MSSLLFHLQFLERVAIRIDASVKLAWKSRAYFPLRGPLPKFTGAIVRLALREMSQSSQNSINESRVARVRRANRPLRGRTMLHSRYGAFIAPSAPREITTFVDVQLRTVQERERDYHARNHLHGSARDRPKLTLFRFATLAPRASSFQPTPFPTILGAMNELRCSFIHSFNVSKHAKRDGCERKVMAKWENEGSIFDARNVPRKAKFIFRLRMFLFEVFFKFKYP